MWNNIFTQKILRIINTKALFRLFFTVHLLLYFTAASAQDTTIDIFSKSVMLKEVVVRSHLDVPSFIKRVENDTSFYKAFKNLRILNYTSLNDIRMLGKKDKLKSSLQSKTQQIAQKGCRSMKTISETVTGNIYDKKGNWNYYTAELYASLFFTKGNICGENNVVGNTGLNTKGKSGTDKHKEQLKMLSFNPGKKIPGLPFIGNKVALFDEDVAQLYDFIIDMQSYQGQNCYVFSIEPRKNLTGSEKDRIVINKMITWFDAESMEIVARTYDLSYSAGVYDFNVQMEVQLSRFQNLLVPTLIRYTGNWHVMFKKREIGAFTASLFDFRLQE